LGGWFAVGWVVEKVFFAALRKLVGKTETEWDDIFIEAAHAPVLLVVCASGIAGAYKFIVPENYKHYLLPYLPLLIKAGVIFSAVLLTEQFVQGAIRHYRKQVKILQISHGFFSLTARLVIYSVGILVILDSVGVSITPIVASLGIGSLAVALALQPTLENLISGFQIILDSIVEPGDFIRLESGEEGFVERIGWRSTWIRQPANNMVIIPNKQMVNTRILNYDNFLNLVQI